MQFALKFCGKLLGFCLLFTATMGIGVCLYAVSLLPSLPSVNEIRRVPLNVPLRVYSSDNKLIAEYGNERRIPVVLDETPLLLIDAILATEDDRFYHHTGVDFPGVARAAISNLRDQSRSQGASTITMQVARNFFLHPEKTYTRKLKEMLLAFRIERSLTKDEILELYLNKIFLGHRAYGFAAAARMYYNQELQNLSVPEIAMLAGLPKAPSRDNPITNPRRAMQRRDHVLQRLHQLGRIDDLSLKTAQAAPITASRKLDEVNFQAPFIAEMVRQWLHQRLDEAAYESGYRVTVTINSKYQLVADHALRNGLYAYDMRHGYHGAVDHLDVNRLSDEALDDALHAYPASRELVPAVVMLVGEETFIALTQRQRVVSVNWQHMAWARAYQTANKVGPEPKRASDIVREGDVVYVRPVEDGSGEWRLAQLPEISGALVSISPDSGAIMALVGGFDYYLSKFNRATQALRQPGSNIKPFIYSAALEHGFTTGSLVSAAPIVVEDDLEGVWRPQNYSRKFFGPTRLREALSRSLNLVSVRLQRAIGVDETIKHLARFGFDPARMPRSLSLALGSTVISPLELAEAYAVLANGGTRVGAYLIEKIEDAEGNPIDLDFLLDEPFALSSDAKREIIARQKLLEEIAAEEVDAVEDPGVDIVHANEFFDGDFADEGAGDDFTVEPGERAISAQNAFLMQSMMRQVILSGTGRRALALGRDDLAGKTGTTNNFKDAWFSGFTPDIVTSVYLGFDEPQHLGRRESGARAALPVWVDYMGKVLPDFEQKEFTPPERIVTQFINRDSGKPTFTEDPDGIDEYFIQGSEPRSGPLAGGADSATESLF